jgi:hypothetical protein
MKKTLNLSLACAKLHAAKPIKPASRLFLSLPESFEGGFMLRMVVSENPALRALHEGVVTMRRDQRPAPASLSLMICAFM